MPDATLPAVIHQMRLEAPGIVSLVLKPSDASRPFPPAQPGAHIDLHLGPVGVRSYSLVHPQQAGSYTIAVLQDPKSRGGSRHVHEQLRVGQVIPVSAPRNHFPLNEDAPATVLIAGGIGITPIFAMLERLAQLGSAAHLIYCARSRREAAYVQELADIVAAHPRLSVHWHWDDVQGGPPSLETLLAGTPASTHLYACGPAPLLNAYEAACARLGLPNAHLERFKAAATAPEPEGGNYTVEMRKSGKRIQVPAGANLLDALLDAECPVAFSCGEVR